MRKDCPALSIPAPRLSGGFADAWIAGGDASHSEQGRPPLPCVTLTSLRTAAQPPLQSKIDGYLCIYPPSHAGRCAILRTSAVI